MDRREPGALDESDELGARVDANVARVEPAQEAIGDPDEPEIARGIGQRKPPARGEHARHLRESVSRSRVVVKGRGAEERVETRVRKGQRLGIADDELGRAQPCRERVRLRDHRRREVDSDRAPHGDRSGGTHGGPAAAADVEEPVASLEREPCERLLLRSSVDA